MASASSSSRFPASLSFFKQPPTLFFRSVILLGLEILANALLWAVTAIVFDNSGKLLSLALVAWTLGLRHGLDADHISAIDNATRRIASIPQTTSDGFIRYRKPVTVGLFFSLGHSTIVITVVMAVAVSTLVASKLDGVSQVGGKIGAAISGSFLVLVAIINSFILAKTWKRIRREKRSESQSESNESSTQSRQDQDLLPTQPNKSRDQSNTKQDSDEIRTQPIEVDVESRNLKEQDSCERRHHQEQGQQAESHVHRFSGLLTRVALPLLKLVTRPWHMYPVGVLFGFGFDTASSITLLSIATVAIRTNSSQDSVQDSSQSAPQVILLALLFTAGMSWVDSMDSIMMIYAYAFVPPKKEKGEKWWDLFEKREDALEKVDQGIPRGDGNRRDDPLEGSEINKETFSEPASPSDNVVTLENTGSSRPQLLVSNSTFSSLSLLLTLLSILLAFAIGTIVVMGLIGDNCSRCSRAADKQRETSKGGLEGRWWLAWRDANDQSGIVGAAIVGTFALILAVYVAIKVGNKRWRSRRRDSSSRESTTSVV